MAYNTTHPFILCTQDLANDRAITVFVGLFLQAVLVGKLEEVFAVLTLTLPPILKMLMLKC